MAELHHDIIIEILLWLPVKSLIRFKCVCKAWHLMISDPKFAKMNLKRSMEDNNFNHQRVFLTTAPLQSIDYEAFTVSDNDNAILELNNPVKKIPESVEIVGSCNGLICLLFDDENMVLWNPATRESKELPMPCSDIWYHGFGYDFSSNDYKVVTGYYYGTAHEAQVKNSIETGVQVLGLKSNIWIFRNDNVHGSVFFDGNGTLFNGALHWLGIQGTDANLKNVVFSFGLAEEKFEEMVPLLDYFEDHNNWLLNLEILGDCLVLFCGHISTSCEVWVMKEFGVKKSWTRLFTVTIETIPKYKYFPTLICFTKDAKFLLNIDSKKLIMYNPKEVTFRNFMIRSDSDLFTGITYVESLVSPNAVVDVTDRENQTQMMEERRNTGMKRKRRQRVVAGKSN